ncbi:V-type proton ATPase subunit G [Erysiphe neolycopersici]|uniref:V-type proton ATPase subunit G n=1 Tax=Erysiphe neolycopersici TaxID=212602 RepID=A0A420HIT5_9PEZI|nr:V-type proton ATPase subunit G [Erysiphe neolycopersici]
MSAQNSAGIQTLLDAEREAQKIVQKAREYRTKRVKEARDEAKKEIDSHKKRKDDELRKYEFEHSSGNKKAEEDANIEVTKKIVEIKELGKKGQEKVIQDLLNAVYEVTPIVPDRIKLSK